MPVAVVTMAMIRLRCPWTRSREVTRDMEWVTPMRPSVCTTTEIAMASMPSTILTSIATPSAAFFGLLP